VLQETDMATKATIPSIKRIYAVASGDDGHRVLIDRLWPRGITKAVARVDLWLKDIAPSDALRRQVHAHPDDWDAFVAAYAQELQAEPAATAVVRLRELMAAGRVTLLYASTRTERNNATALRDWLARS
jgi:uncharacterized protein YeaO (DUF488 family)